MKKRFTEEIMSYRMKIENDNKCSALFSGKNSTFMEFHIIDQSAYDENCEKGCADVYGYRDDEFDEGGIFDVYYVKKGGYLWRRNSILEVGRLLEAMETENAVNGMLQI
jgi:hypothetical protein